jgi:hypothetical protein
MCAIKSHLQRHTETVSLACGEGSKHKFCLKSSVGIRLLSASCSVIALSVKPMFHAISVTANTAILFRVKYFNNNLADVSDEHVAFVFSVEE